MPIYQINETKKNYIYISKELRQPNLPWFMEVCSLARVRLALGGSRMYVWKQEDLKICNGLDRASYKLLICNTYGDSSACQQETLALTTSWIKEFLLHPHIGDIITALKEVNLTFISTFQVLYFFSFNLGPKDLYLDKLNLL